MFNANLEFRFPIYKSFGAVLFQDVGILSQSGFLGFKDRWYPGTVLDSDIRHQSDQSASILVGDGKNSLKKIINPMHGI
jgi:outer membrane protein assembly factor BamA